MERCGIVTFREEKVSGLVMRCCSLLWGRALARVVKWGTIVTASEGAWLHQSLRFTLEYSIILFWLDHFYARIITNTKNKKKKMTSL